MANKGFLLVLALVAAGLIFWFAGGADLIGGGASSDDDPGGDGGTSLLGAEGRGADAEKAAGAGAGGPVLFGRARELRVGKGGLTGRVMDFTSGKPVAGAHVVIAGEGYGQEVVALQGDSDAQGRFRIEDVPAGDAYTVHAQGGGHQRTLGGVAVEAGATEGLGTLWLGERGVLRGRVVDAEGQGVVGAMVHVHRGGSFFAMIENIADIMEQLDTDSVPMAKGESGAKGRFEIKDVDPGPILLVVRAPGFAQGMESGVMTAKGAAGGEAVVRLRPSAPILGVVVDETGRGVAGARVACMSKNDMNTMFYGRYASTADAEGAFRIDSPPALDRLTMIVAASGYPTLFTQAEAGEEPLRLVLRGGVEVQVRIVAQDSNRPIAGARLMAMFGEKGVPSSDDMSYVSGRTDEAGEALFSAREGMLSMLWFSHPEHGTSMYAPAMPKGAGSLIEGPEDARVKKPRTRLEFRVTHGITIRGHVLDEAGAGIPGVKVSAVGGMGFGASRVSDAEGAFELLGQSKEISMVIARAPGYVQEDPQRRKKDGEGGPDADGVLAYDIRMLRAVSVTGRVLDAAGQPVVGARVKLGSDDGMGMLTAMFGGGGESITSGGGRYVLEGARPGKKIHVMARLGGYLDCRSADFETKAGGANHAPDIALLRGTRLRIKVLGPDGAPAAGARVQVGHPKGAPRVSWEPMNRLRALAELRTSERGTVEVPHAAAGELTLKASLEGTAGARKTLTVTAEDEDVDVEVRLREAFVLRGRVVDANGGPVAGASLVTQPPQDATDDGWIPAVTATADKEGRFALEDLPGQRLTLYARAEGFRRGRMDIADLRGEVEVRLEPVSGDNAARLKEIQTELQEIYERFAEGMGEEEQKAVLERMQELQEEQKLLQGEHPSQDR